MKKDILINRFYRSDDWKRARAIKIALAGGLCQKCSSIGVEVHHVIHITPQNVTDPNITLNQENLLLLCRECHNEEHNRFKKTKQKFDKNGNLLEK